MRDVLREKDKSEKMLNGKESEIDLLRKKLSDVGYEITNKRSVYERICLEKDEIKIKLNAQEEDVDELSVRLVETEKQQKEIEVEVEKLRVKYVAL
ncbi:hypothetical protein CQW23_14390 [Capsicum baccatum]|uniref:Uncharacterized protein n=1 Tax=Capsicum baccatum TaxID=33114 RepID=A0A2G2WJ39_CAPBA|nr:hypothetical protein CQW23_14390 [Capsicum baccatum]